MEKLSSAYEYLWQVCGTWGIALLIALVVLFFVQYYYWAIRYSRIPSYRETPRGNERPAVSIVMVLRETDYSFLDERLPELLAQEYDRFEVVVIDLTGDVEFSEALMVIAEHNRHFTSVRMVRDTRFPISDKMALNVAIKSARNDNILLTTVDSSPASRHWAERMARGFDGADVVIGYCGMTEGHGFSGRLLRAARACHSVRWLSAAIHGKPYRGTIHNIGFTKKLYLDNGGFNFLNMNIGEDDLFIQKLLSNSHATVVVTANSLVRQHVWGGLSWWYAGRRLHSNTFKYYPAGTKLYIATELWSRALFFASVAASAAILPPEIKIFAAALLLLRFGLVMFEMRRISIRLSERGIVRMVPLLDICSPFYEAWMSIDRKFRRTPGIWR